MGRLPILSRIDQFPKHMSFPGGSAVKESACSEGDLGSIPGREDPLEKDWEMHSGILAWEIPWIKEAIV